MYVEMQENVKKHNPKVLIFWLHPQSWNEINWGKLSWPGFSELFVRLVGTSQGKQSQFDLSKDYLY